MLRVPRKGGCQEAEQSFGMFTIHIHAIVFELIFWRKKKEERKKEEERRRTKSKFSCVIFLNAIKVSRTFIVELAIE